MNVFLLGTQPKEVSCCLQRAVSASFCVPSTKFIFSKQRNKEQILQIYLFLLFVTEIKTRVLPEHSNNIGKLRKKI